MLLSFFQKNQDNTIHVNEIDGILSEIQLIDIRESYEWAGGSIKNAKNIPMGELLNQPDKYLDKNKKYYILCQSGMRSARTTLALHQAGFDVVNVKGGMSAYTGNNRG